MAHETRDELVPEQRAHRAQPVAELAVTEIALASAQSEIRRYESQKSEWQCQLAEKQLLLQTRAAEIDECKAEIRALRDRIRELESRSANTVASINRDIEVHVPAGSVKVGDSVVDEMEAGPSGRRWFRRKQKRRWQIRKDR